MFLENDFAYKTDFVLQFRWDFLFILYLFNNVHMYRQFNADECVEEEDEVRYRKGYAFIKYGSECTAYRE